MSQIIKIFSDSSLLEYDYGKFDRWCVYLTRPNSKRYAPVDIEYFTQLQKYSTVHGPDKVYKDFVNVFKITSKKIEKPVLDEIENLSKKYSNDAIDIEIIFTIVYAGMIAEQNKAYTKLGKRVKRLGIHQVLIEGMSPYTAANYSKGKGWRELDTEMKTLGF